VAWPCAFMKTGSVEGLRSTCEGGDACMGTHAVQSCKRDASAERSHDGRGRFSINVA
jgi:hypothetical protein